MISILQQIKNNLRNKRFIMFTLLFPSIWYIFFVYFLKNATTINLTSLAIFCAMFGIGGSGLNTFSTKISNEINYYGKVRYYSPYTYLKYIKDSIVAQTMLHLFIVLVVTFLGLIINKIDITTEYVFLSLLLIFYGVYYICIGFILGITLKSETLNSVSLPIYMIFMSMNLTSNVINFGDFNWLKYIQKIFPGYYFNNMLNNFGVNEVVQFTCITSLHILFLLIFIGFIEKRNVIKNNV